MNVNECAWVIKKLGYNSDDIINSNNLENRLVIQKIIYFLRYVKNKNTRDEEFSLYIRGPYSKTLANICYVLAKDKNYESRISELSNKYEVNTEIEKIIDDFRNKDIWWMELANTIIMIYRRDISITKEELFTLVKSAEPWATKNTFGKVIKGLRQMNIINI